ncbi:hypothetical protein LCGC14_2986910 [marine sediment metagenome]|uniref:Sporulation stage II protein D amidase enhancer LytB N-terminal domain-containing protein n=1 Tax=marine sediment metagenome TaxID=412755 RepID=A0A0F8XSI0_9ZZZZ
MDPTPGMSLAENLWVRVLLFDNIKECRLSCESGFSLVGKENGAKAVFDAGAETIVITLSNGSVKAGEHVFGEEVTLQPDTPFVFDLNGKQYRGNLRLIVNRDSKTFDAINVVPAESYLAGVVGAEMPSYWEGEALKAQAIAARTYCLYTKMNSGKDRRWDVKGTQAHQVYDGIKAETKTVWTAIRQTAGKVLVHKDSEGDEKMFPTFYSSTCGGNSSSYGIGEWVSLHLTRDEHTKFHNLWITKIGVRSHGLFDWIRLSRIWVIRIINISGICNK